MTLTVVKARHRHIRTIAARMRSADTTEVAALSGLSPADVLRFSLDRSEMAFTVKINGRPEAMFGVGLANALLGIGVVWLLGTDAVETNYRTFLRGSVQWKERLLQRYKLLTNVIHDGNTVSKRWLGWLGAEFKPPFQFKGHAFRVFELRASDV